MTGTEKAIGARLRALRVQRGMSRHDVEVASGGRWKQASVGSWERGYRAIIADLDDYIERRARELVHQEADRRIARLEGPLRSDAARTVTSRRGRPGIHSPEGGRDARK